ncbi:Xaa-Pro dipeptidase [Geothrix oryzae]|uniref:Xaa-Pro dipeptidase n=1 Tax=Geothrix oryzae TaxID=2927975 RepID=A0ABM8DQ83_9BACT|nr:Xaa-Pro dipeptidase [Geothrix oryzae]BDU69119.1 Xaa-Pro dipeptidase [Geothrix oryzae]
MTDLAALYLTHIAERQRTAAEALAETGFDALVISSGKVYTHFADDQDAPFHPVPHFAHWCPVAGPHHLLVIRPGQKPRLIRYAPEDFWYEQAPLGNPFWASAFELEEAGTVDEVWKLLGSPARAAYIGNETDRAEAAGLEVNPAGLTARLDWHRTTKSSYEVQCIEEATVLAARGHLAAKAAFLAGASELEIHHAYVQAVGIVDHELPYGSIVALNEKGATLHYEGKRTLKNGFVMLIDAGAQVRGYASDITRTVAAPHCDSRFAALVDGMEKIELQLCDLVKPGLPYGDLHHQGHLAIAGLLKDHGLLNASPEEAVEKGYSRPFFPHGLGHHLGIQVHDVAGRQGGPDGTVAPPPAQHPTLRTTRTIDAGQVFTVEPGLYFIPMLLRPFRAGEDRAKFNWTLIDELTPCGGIRIEDNLLVTADGHRNLTRPHLPN